MAEHLAKDVDADVSAVHTYTQPFGVTIGIGGSVKTALTDKTFNRISDTSPLGTGATTIVSERAIKEYVDSSSQMNMFGAVVPVTLDVVGNIAISATQRHLLVSSYTGTSGTLSTISGTINQGTVIIIRAASGHTIRVSATTLAIGADCVLGSVGVDCIVLMKYAPATNGWLEISRSTNYYA